MSAEPRRYALSWEEACAQAAEDAAKLAARLREDDARARLHLTEKWDGWLSGWRGRVTDTSHGQVLAEVHGWTKRAMYRRRYRAYLAQVDRLAAERRAES